MGFEIFDEQLVSVQMRKIKTLINNPFDVGFSVFELSKLVPVPEFESDLNF